MANEQDAPASALEVSDQVRERLAYIEDLLFWFGRAGRNDLTRRFGVSTAAATKDIAAYREIQPTPLLYDGKTRSYQPHGEIEQILTKQSLSRLIDIGVHAEVWGSGFLDIGLLQPPTRAMNLSVIRHISRAIASKLDVRIVYRSVTSGPSERWISPHAIASDGLRWHARAYDHAKNRYADFVLSRIVSVQNERPATIDPDQDHEWSEFEDIVMAPHPGLSPAARETVLIDFDMKDGRTIYPCRKAMAFYARKRFMLTDEFSSLAPETRQVVEVTP